MFGKINALLLMVFSTFFVAEGALAQVGNCRTQAEFTCMKNTINGEARNQGYEGMRLVGLALITRYHRGYVGGSVCGISRQSFVPRGNYPTSGQANKTANANVDRAAREACNSGDAGVTHFHTRAVNPRWAKQFPRVHTSHRGAHLFYNAPRSVKADVMDQDSYRDAIEEFDLRDQNNVII